MLADECREMNFLSPQSIGGSAVTLVLYVNNMDKITSRAVAAGAKLVQPVADMLYDDRAGTAKIHWDVYGILQQIRKIYHLKKSRSEQLLTMAVILGLRIV